MIGVRLPDLAYLPAAKVELDFYRNNCKIAIIIDAFFGFLGLFFSSIGLVTFFGYGANSVAYCFTALGEIMLGGAMYSIHKTEKEVQEFIKAKKEPLSEKNLKKIINSSKKIYIEKAHDLQGAEEQKKEELLSQVRRLNAFIRETKLDIDLLGVRRRSPQSSPDDF